MMACVVREGRHRDTKGARQAEGPRCAGRSGPSDGPGPGGGIAGYSRELLRGALIYAGRGVPVFPCKAGGKRPLTADGFLEATTDRASIRRWWGRWPNANVAIPTGERSGLLVLDVDSDEGTDSVALLEPFPKRLAPWEPRHQATGFRIRGAARQIELRPVSNREAHPFRETL
jgi:hypothetical protein